MADFFEKIFITEEFEKVGAMAKIVKKFPRSTIVFIDDRLVPLEAIKKSLPQVKTVRIRRFSHQEPTNSSLIDFEIKSLVALAKKNFLK